MVMSTEPEGEEDEEVGGILVLLPPKTYTWILAQVGSKTSKFKGDMALYSTSRRLWQAAILFQLAHPILYPPRQHLPTCSSNHPPPPPPPPGSVFSPSSSHLKCGPPHCKQRHHNRTHLGLKDHHKHSRLGPKDHHKHTLLLFNSSNLCSSRHLWSSSHHPWFSSHHPWFSSHHPWSSHSKRTHSLGALILAMQV